MAPTKTRTQLSHSAIRKSGPRKTPRASSLASKLMLELHRRLALATICLYTEGYTAVAMRLLSCMCRPLLLVTMGCRGSSCGSRQGEGIHGEGVDDGHVGDEDALWQGQEDVALILGVKGRAVNRSTCTGSEARETAEGGSRAEAMPALCTAWRKNPFRMSWRILNCAARAEHCMPWLVYERCRVDPRPHCKVGALSGRMARLRRCQRAV
jgi:hypothetical protein